MIINTRHCEEKAYAEAPKRLALSTALELNDGDVGQLRLRSDLAKRSRNACRSKMSDEAIHTLIMSHIWIATLRSR